MNNDLISREALKKCARVVFDKDLGRLRVVDVSDIDNAPTVDMNTELSVAYLKGRRQGQSDVRPQGEWSIDNRPSIGGLWKCSECNEHYPYKTKFCPNCGAKMKGGKE